MTITPEELKARAAEAHTRYRDAQAALDTARNDLDRALMEAMRSAVTGRELSTVTGLHPATISALARRGRERVASRLG